MNLFIFGVYLVMLVVIGYTTFLKTKVYGDFTLAGRSNNKWIVAMGAESADMSGWIFLGLPGWAFSTGFGSIWLVSGLMFGTFFNWTVVAPRIRRITEYYHAVTLSDFIEKRLGDKTGIVSVVFSIVIVVFMIINSSAEIIGCGKLLTAAFGFNYHTGMYIGLGIALIYTFLGGFLAVSWSNLVQGTMMFIALILVPVAALFHFGSLNSFSISLLSQDKNMFSFLSGAQGFWPISGVIVSGLGIMLCYPGQPHVLTNYMSIKDPDELKSSTLISMIWVGLTLYGAVIIGMAGRSMFPSIQDPEQVFLPIVKSLFPSQTIGLFAAAIMAAILSSVGAYLFVAAASFASGLYKKIAKIKDDNQLIPVQRVSVVLIALVALLISLNGGKVMQVALYAFAGLGAGLGPMILFSIYSSRINVQGAIWGMAIGMVTVLLWSNLGLSQYLYEAVPAFVLGSIAIVVVSKLSGGPDKLTKEQYLDFVLKEGQRKKVVVEG